MRFGDWAYTFFVLPSGPHGTLQTSHHPLPIAGADSASLAGRPHLQRTTRAPQLPLYVPSRKLATKDP